MSAAAEIPSSLRNGQIPGTASEQQGWVKWLMTKISATFLSLYPRTPQRTQEISIKEFVDMFDENPKVTIFSDVYHPLCFDLDRKPIQQVLAPFFNNPEDINQKEVLKFVEAYNTSYPKSEKWDVDPIHPKKDLLSELVRVVGSMIVRGELALTQGIGLYREYLPSLIEKVRKHQANPSLTAGDIAYQRMMLNLFRITHGMEN